MVNPLSAIILSPASHRSTKPDKQVISTSDIPPVYNGDTNVTVPCGDIPISDLNVGLLLYLLYSCELSISDEGFSVYSSVQSMITRVDGYDFRKLSGM